MKRLSILLMVCVMGTISLADVLLNDTFADASRTETSLPTESAVWAGTPASVTMDTGSLAYAQSSSSQKLWTYFASDGDPVSLNVGEKLVVTMTFSAEGAFHDSTSRNFRFGLFNDPTDGQLLSDTNSDNGGGLWYDSTGYGVMFSLSSTTASTIQVGKRTNITGTDGLISSTGSYTWGAGTGGASNLTLDTIYTMTLTLDYISADVMQVDFTFADDNGFSTSASLTDNELGGLPVYTDFDQLFFRFSKTDGTADVIDFHSFTVEYIVPEPATLILLGLGSLVSLKKRR